MRFGYKQKTGGSDVGQAAICQVSMILKENGSWTFSNACHDKTESVEHSA